MSKSSLRSLELLPVWVASDHLVTTARFVAKGHGLPLIPVVKHEELLGYVLTETLLTAPEEARVGDLAVPFKRTLDADLSIREAALIFVAEHLSLVPVVEGNQFLGLLASNDLLKALSYSVDPLTRLPWIETLREWGIRELARGNELTMLCFDLDDFGLYNKRYGHQEGDLVLSRMGQEFSKALNPEQDILVRFGGDEFLLATLRSHSDTLALAARMREVTSGEAMRDLHEPISFSVGVSGGKRTREREHTHYAAMLDNLIRLAVEDCRLHKGYKPSTSVAGRTTSIPSQGAVLGTGTLTQPSAAQTPGPPILGAQPTGATDVTSSTAVVPSLAPVKTGQLSLVSVQVTEGPRRSTQVILQRVVAGALGTTQDVTIMGGADFEEQDIDRSVALATCRACEAFEPSVSLTIESILRFDDPSGSRWISVNGFASYHGDSETFAGSARLTINPTHAVVGAVLDGFSRVRTDATRRQTGK